MKYKKPFSKIHDNIIRTEIADDIIKKINQYFIFLSGQNGSGKSHIAKGISENLEKNKRIAKAKSLFWNECISSNEKQKECQIYDYESFLSNTLLKYINEKNGVKNKSETHIMTADFTIDSKESLCKQCLSETNIVFVFDDFEKLKIDDRDRVFNFLEKNVDFSKHSVIFTSSKPLIYYSNVPRNIYEKKNWSNRL